MKRVLISPFAQNLRNGAENPKNYPYWDELLALINKEQIKITQIGSSKDKQLPFVDSFLVNEKYLNIKNLIKEHDTWISVDSFIQHLNHYYDKKPGIVIWSQSDPKIFGYDENVNILKHRKYLREKQFWLWEQCQYNKEAYVNPTVVRTALLKLLNL
jgi:ADP-heptose:LPS heptosyltransferase